ncbi:MAG: glycosyltransferase [Fibrobacteria bacterium]|nr:glycosyltransferase [Fibrobacteria bacterium]
MENPSVALVGDNLDEVNGIALSSRTLVRTMRRQGRRVYLIGVAFHTKPARMEEKGGAIFMVPGCCSMDQPGYEGSETAIPKIGLVVKLLRRYPIDLIEIEVPGGVGFTTLVLAKILGIKTITHYRTDLIAYFKFLIKNPLGVWALNTWVTLFTRFGGPVVVPSRAFKPKIIHMGVSQENIHILPRGVALSMFNPEKKTNGAWERSTSNYSGIRIIYLGRISQEKNLDMLIENYPLLGKKDYDVNLTIIGEGPYLEEMKQCLSQAKKIDFTGFLRGTELAGVLAAADIMAFPSTTDTFGNTVLEALASGIPCIVSNQGGPQEIIEDGKSGLVFDPNVEGDFLKKIIFLMEKPDILESFKKAARERALQFTHENSADTFWAFYQNLLADSA